MPQNSRLHQRNLRKSMVNRNPSPAFADPGLLQAQQAYERQQENQSSQVQYQPAKVTVPAPWQTPPKNLGFADSGRFLAEKYDKGLGRGVVDYGRILAEQAEKERYEELSSGVVDYGRLLAEVYDKQAYESKISSGMPDYGRLQAEQLDKKNEYGVKSEALVKMAESQLNTKEGYDIDKDGTIVWNNDNPYGEWYGNPKDAWCAQFASWNANKVGSLNTDENKNSDGIPKNQSTSQFISDYITMDRFANGYASNKDADNPYNNKNPYKPKAGDFIFLQWWEDGELNGHTGIVVAYDEKTKKVYTIEGNAGAKTNGVFYRSRDLNADSISGYGINGGTSYGIIPDLSKNRE